MPNYSIFRLKNHALLMALASAYPVISYAAGPAQIDFAAGGVTAVNSTGAQRPLTKGAEVSNGDTIRTGEGGRAQVRFSDGALVSLQPATEFRIDNYQFANKPDGQEKGFFSLLKGGMRTITGLIGRSNRDNYKVTTSVATIGIRGTEYGRVESIEWPTGSQYRRRRGRGLQQCGMRPAGVGRFRNRRGQFDCAKAYRLPSAAAPGTADLGRLAGVLNE
ncbi:MAG: FecR domain-containing protein [Betaproteobacteria bacterium]|uniref:FecR domain-containing protein n=1 Tax=Candidatus Proximibacter danicus TaxID=2954365 RepID=A0A9D7JZI3_9PROT|nr:FecR domain-containing protein [Candidatus Proximibacter danicus]